MRTKSITYTKIYHFLVPLIGLAIVMNIFRFFFGGAHPYLWLNWNLFLALVPLLFLFLFEKRNGFLKRRVFFLLWLFFLPNALYIITDFIHLRDAGASWILWYDAMMIFLYALIGIVVHSYSLFRMGENLSPQTRKRRKAFFFVISLLTAFGIYLGRYLRLNSWDIIAHPVLFVEKFFQVFFESMYSLNFYLIIIFFTSFSLLFIYLFHFFQGEE